MGKRVKKFIDIDEIEKNYRIEEDGAVWSYMRNRYLKPILNTAGYFHVFIAKPFLGWIGVSRLVACKYIGQCPEGLETSHKDGDRTNNHWTNFKYISHRDNVLKSYREHGRISYGPRGYCHTWEAKQLMALKKEKAVIASDGRKWDSIQKCADDIGVSRRTVYSSIVTGHKSERIGAWLSFYSPVPA
jgi:hypothetical protein